MGGLAVVLKVFLPIAAAWLLPSTGPSFLKDLLKPLHAQGAVKFVFLLLGEPRCPRTQTLWLWLVEGISARGGAPGGAAHGQILTLFTVAAAFRATRWRHNLGGGENQSPWDRRAE
jgi:hypothetical protein